MKTRIIVIVMFVMVFSSNSFAVCINTERHKETLKNLEGVYLDILIHPKLFHEGLIPSQVRSDLESKLRLAGIKVASKENILNNPMVSEKYGFVILTLDVNGFKRSPFSPYIIYTIEFDVWQAVSLHRDQEIETAAVTWAIEAIGYVMDITELRDNIKVALDEFINAYLSVNPKK